MPLTRPNRWLARFVLGSLGVGLLAAIVLWAAPRPEEGSDLLDADLQHWLDVARDTTAHDELSVSTREGSAAILERAQQNLRDGYRNLALFRLTAVRPNLV